MLNYFKRIKTLEIVLINQSKESMILNFKVLSTDLAQRWASALIEIFKDDLLLEKHYNFLGFAKAKRSLDLIAKDINEQIKVINLFSWKGQYLISENAKTIGPMDQAELNALHHHFEILIGQVWKKASWFKEAPHNVQVAILLLNNFIHEYEFKLKALSKLKRRRSEQRLASSIFAAFTAAPHFDLTRKDYKYFSLHRKFGDVFLHYSQLGKTFEEAFNDRDEHIDEKNISGLRYYTGEFDVHLGETGVFQHTCDYIEELHRWITEKGIDPNNPALALGEIKVGELQFNRNIKNKTQEQIEDLLSDNWEISSLGLKRTLPFFSISRSYPYTGKETPRLMQKFFKLGFWR